MLANISKAQEAFNDHHSDNYSPLTPEEINGLISLGNYAESWNDIFLQTKIKDENRQKSLQAIRSCTFIGRAYLGEFNRDLLTPDQSDRTCGIINCKIKNCVIEDACYLSNTTVTNSYISRNSRILECGFVFADCLHSFGNGMIIEIGPETGGRRVHVHSDLRFPDICQMALVRNDSYFLKQCKQDAQIFKDKVAINFTFIGANTKIIRCDRIHNCYIGDNASVFSSNLQETCVLSTESEPVTIEYSSSLYECIIQYGSQIGPNAHASRTMLLEHSSLGEHCRANHSIIAPDSSVGGGECSHSLVGPFVGMHHQSLLIASIWPFGRGNIGYGAMLGANHTGRLNDQENLIGEGVFFGLGVAIKFPFNTLYAPYSIIASGSSCLPQKMAFPFSLMSPQEGTVEGISPMLTVLKPGWILSENPYLLERAQRKFSQRRKAVNHSTSLPVIRPSVIYMIIDARRRLQSVNKPEIPGNSKEVTMKEEGDRVYTEREVQGLGKSILFERDRLSAIRNYSDCIQRYALQGLVHELKKKDISQYEDVTHNLMSNQPDEHIGIIDVNEIERRLCGYDMLISDLVLFDKAGEDESTTDFWKFQQSLLRYEFQELLHSMSSSSTELLKALLGKYLDLETNHERSVRSCRQKDENRGERIIPDYKFTHDSADTDPVVISVFSISQATKNEIQIILSNLA